MPMTSSHTRSPAMNAPLVKIPQRRQASAACIWLLSATLLTTRLPLSAAARLDREFPLGMQTPSFLEKEPSQKQESFTRAFEEHGSHGIVSDLVEPWDGDIPGHASHWASHSSGDLEIREGDIGVHRGLLHGCHKNGSSRKARDACSRLPKCPDCSFPRKTSKTGHCKYNRKYYKCERKNPQINKPSLAGSSNTPRIGESDCPNILAATRPGHFQQTLDLDIEEGIFNITSGEEIDYHEFSDTEVVDYYYDGDLDDEPLTFWAVDTPETLQQALMNGTKHVLIVEHLNTTGLQPVEDLPLPTIALNAAIARVLPTTLTIVGRCSTPPPESFGLTEPVPEGACAILVKEDFLDAPNGTSCLLLDSLYIALHPPGPTREESAVLILHVAGAMWITNSVFQGAGVGSRAIDMNTRNEADREPELFVQNTTFVGFTRIHGPGIRMLQHSTLWLDSVEFQDIALISSNVPGKKLQDFAGGGPLLPVGTALLGFSDVSITTLGLKIENNTVDGEPAGSRAVTVSLVGSEVLAYPRMEVWNWPDWNQALIPENPVALSDDDTQFAMDEIVGRLRPEIEQIRIIQQDIADQGLRELETQRPEAASRYRRARAVGI